MLVIIQLNQSWQSLRIQKAGLGYSSVVEHALSMCEVLGSINQYHQRQKTTDNNLKNIHTPKAGNF